MVLGVHQGGIGIGDSNDQIAAFIQQTGVTFPIVKDSPAPKSYDQFSNFLGDVPSPFPLDVVIDRTGTIRYISHEYSAGDMNAAIGAAK